MLLKTNNRRARRVRKVVKLNLVCSKSTLLPSTMQQMAKLRSQRAQSRPRKAEFRQQKAAMVSKTKSMQFWKCRQVVCSSKFRSTRR